MIEQAKQVETPSSWIREKFFQGQGLTDYAKGLITPFNVIAGLIVLFGLILVVIRFALGLGTVTSASQEQPWGLFLAWGLFSGVPMSATGFVLGTAVYVFGLKEYHPVVKNAILLGFLGYLFAVIFLLIDLGRPWRLPYPMTISFGTASVLFLVAWHVALYLSCQFLEFYPSVGAWAGWQATRKWATSIIVGLTIAGIVLSTLHQSALGAMYLLSPAKLHPLWYTTYLPFLFLASAIAAGLCVVIFASFMSKRFFRNRADAHYLASLDGITLGLGKAAAFVLVTYFALKVVALAHGNHWDLLNTPYGYWYLVELLGFVLIPTFLFAVATRARKVGLVQFTAVFTLVGVVLNRLNVSLIALNWKLPERELFNWKEFAIVVAIVAVELLVYRWIINRMHVLQD